MDEGMRPIDLARAVGVSTQQVRKLEAARVLPEVERTESGYRRYTVNHLRALQCYQELATGHGPLTARELMVLLHQHRISDLLALLDQSQAGLHAQRQELQQIQQTLQTLGQDPDEKSLPRSAISITQLARRLDVKSSTLRVWEDAGLLFPEREGTQRHRLYGPQDIRDARIVRILRRAGYLFDRIRPIIEEIHNAGSTEALHRALQQRYAAITGQSQAMLKGAAWLNEYIEHLQLCAENECCEIFSP